MVFKIRFEFILKSSSSAKISNLVLKKKAMSSANEPVMDAFRDSAVYGIIAEIVYNGKWGK